LITCQKVPTELGLWFGWSGIDAVAEGSGLTQIKRREGQGATI